MTYVLLNPTERARTSLRESYHTPAADVLEGADGYTIALDLPGIEKESIKVVVNDGLLTVSGERRRTDPENTDFYRSWERPAGTFQRVFRIPDDVVDGNTVNATFENGVLTLGLKKREKAKPRTIAVN